MIWFICFLSFATANITIKTDIISILWYNQAMHTFEIAWMDNDASRSVTTLLSNDIRCWYLGDVNEICYFKKTAMQNVISEWNSTRNSLLKIYRVLFHRQPFSRSSEYLLRVGWHFHANVVTVLCALTQAEWELATIAPNYTTSKMVCYWGFLFIAFSTKILVFASHYSGVVSVHFCIFNESPFLVGKY